MWIDVHSENTWTSEDEPGSARAVGEASVHYSSMRPFFARQLVGRPLREVEPSPSVRLVIDPDSGQLVVSVRISRPGPDAPTTVRVRLANGDWQVDDLMETTGETSGSRTLVATVPPPAGVSLARTEVTLALDRPSSEAQWDDFVARTSGLSDPQVAVRRTIAVIAAADESLPAPSSWITNTRLPDGRPSSRSIRTAAAELIRVAPTAPTPALVQELHALGLAHLMALPQHDPGAPNPDHEFRALRAHLEQAIDLVEQNGLMHAWLMERLAKAHHLLRDRAGTERVAEAAGTIVAAWRESHAPADTVLTTIADAAGVDLDYLAEEIAVEALRLVAQVAWSSGDQRRAVAGYTAVLDLVGGLQERHPRRFAAALSNRAAVARSYADATEFRRIEDELRHHAAVSTEYENSYFRTAGDNSILTNELVVAARHHRARIAAVSRAAGLMPGAAEPTVERAARIVALLDAMGERSALRSVGNAAFVQMSVITTRCVGSGTTAGLDEAMEWVDVADSAWRGYGVNGPVAATLARSRIRLLSGALTARERDDEVLTLVEVSRRTLQGGTRRGALDHASACCRVDDERVLQRLEELVSRDDISGLGSYQAYVARLHSRRAEVSAAGSVESLECWRLAERYALLAAATLARGRALMRPRVVAECYDIAARAAAALPDSAPAEVLHRYLEAVHACASAMIAVGTLADRNHLRATFARTFAAAAAAAAAAGDHRAADQVIEALRRDRVGVLLTALAHDPDVGRTVRDTAARVVAATARLGTGGGAAPGTGTRSSAADHHRDALTAAESVIGPLAKLADPSTLRSVSAADVLRSVVQPFTTVTAAVLQLCPLSVSPFPGQHVAVVRRLTTLEAGVVTDEVEVIDVPRRLLSTENSALDHLDLLEDLAEALLPASLAAFLDRADGEARLLIVPTGFHLVPFDALPVDDRRQLVDVACTTIHTSLSAALATTGQRVPRGRDLRVLSAYDTNALAGAAGEERAIAGALGQPRRVESAKELLLALDPSAPAVDLLALGVHGSSDLGWAHSKLMPDGSVLYPVDLLSVNVPAWCVLASCDSSITAEHGIELAGFPQALFLRGADTVIGSLFAIPDEETGQIMALFWDALGRERNPVRALQRARRSWLTKYPARRSQPRTWAGLLAYGGTHL